MDKSHKEIAKISIHALREEGDVILHVPSQAFPISIHALREEGDGVFTFAFVAVRSISIHALREEGDRPPGAHGGAMSEFLSTPSARRATPRPPS